MKKFFLITSAAIIACCFLLSGCGNTVENKAPASDARNESDIPLVIIPENSSEPETISTTVPQSTFTQTNENSTVSEPPNQEPVGTTTEPQSNPTPPESTSQTESVSTEEAPAEVNSPQWNETAFNGEFYVNTDDIYSRVNAIQGSETVARYKLNDKVTVTAKTDTDYYKLNDGTFIHSDFLSENEIAYNTEIGSDYIAVSATGYVIEMINGITYVDGIMIANKTYSLPKSYDPGTRQEAADALEEMQRAAAAEGLSLYVVSGYRSYQTQESVYAGWVNRDGMEQADTYSSRAGHSDHQTGYTFDLNSLEQSFAYTPEGIWLAEHCAEFGFIIRYPEGKEMYTGYIYEPWHVRYIGKEKAKIITESGLSLEEYYGITSNYDD